MRGEARWECIKNPAAAGLDCLICDRDRVGHRTALKLPFARCRPKLPATAGQPAGTRESAGCRNRLLTGYRALESDSAAETPFLQSPVIVSEVTLGLLET